MSCFFSTHLFRHIFLCSIPLRNSYVLSRFPGNSLFFNYKNIYCTSVSRCSSETNEFSETSVKLIRNSDTIFKLLCCSSTGFRERKSTCAIRSPFLYSISKSNAYKNAHRLPCKLGLKTIFVRLDFNELHSV